MVLDFSFIIAASLIVAGLIPLYIYRREIYSKFQRKGSINHFLKEVEIYLSVNHPKITFDYSITNKYEEEKDMVRKQMLIAEELVNQYAYHEFEFKTQGGVPKDKLWNSYDKNSKLLKDNKFPPDWPQRKEAAWSRDNGKCDRCGTKTKLVDANVFLAKQMKDGGGFNLENIVVLCSDCSRVIKTENIERTKKDLRILDNLMRRVTD